MDLEDLQLVEMVINEPGVGLIEDEILKHVKGNNNVDRITGIPHEDGQLKGVVHGLNVALGIIQGLRKQCKEQQVLEG